MAEAASSDTACRLGNEMGVMLSGMPEQFLRMVISRRRDGSGDAADGMFRILTDMETRLSRLDPAAVQRFTDAARSSLPRGHRVLFDQVIALAWCGNPPGLVDREFPGTSGPQLEEALSAWRVDGPAAAGEMLAALRLDESLQRARHTGHRWRHMWQVDELIHKRPLVGRHLRVSPGACPCAEDAGAAVVQDVVASGSSREGVGFRTLGLTPGTWEVAQASDTDLMMELGPSTLTAQLELAALCDCGAPLASAGYVLLNYPKSARCTLPGRCPFSAPSLYIALRSESGLRSTVRSGPAFTAVALQSERAFAYDLDLVLSLPDVAWPEGVIAAYEQRQQFTGSVTRDMVRRLVSTRLYMVAAGFKPSPSAEHQWRYSFSLQECMLMRMLEPQHRECLVTLKIAKNLLGSRVPQLKSYHLKTGVMWLAEKSETPDSLHDHLMSVLDFVLENVEKGDLPCYFWTEINLLSALTDEEKTEMAASLRRMRSTLLSILNLYVHWAVLGVTMKQDQGEHLYSSLSDVDRLAISCACFSKFCADRLHREAYERHREAALQEKVRDFCRLPDVAAQRRLVTLLQHPLPDGSLHLIHAIASMPSAAGALFPLRQVRGEDELEYWELELTWFFQEGVRQQAVPYLSELEAALFCQSQLPPEARVAGLPAELCRPVRLLTAHQLCRLYVQHTQLLLCLLPLDQHLLIPSNLAREDVQKTDTLIKHVGLADLRDKWMEDGV